MSSEVISLSILQFATHPGANHTDASGNMQGHHPQVVFEHLLGRSYTPLPPGGASTPLFPNPFAIIVYQVT